MHKQVQLSRQGCKHASMSKRISVPVAHAHCMQHAPVILSSRHPLGLHSGCGRDRIVCAAGTLRLEQIALTLAYS